MSSDTAVLDLCSALIARRSLTPDDAGCCDLIGERLSALGFTLERINAGGVTNLWATLGENGPLTILAGHTDVVPTGPLEQWHSDPFVPTVRDGVLYGRGAADMKSGLAAMVCAVERLLARRSIAGQLAFLITSDEEGSARYGTRYVVETLKQRGVRPDYAIVGEATAAESLGDRVTVGRRGSLGCNLRVNGKQGHVAYPEKADNPIHRLAPALAELVATRWDEGNAHFPPTSFQISNLHAGTGANNVVPGHADLVFNFRYCTESTAEDLKARVTEVLDRHGLSYEADWWHSGEPFLTGPGKLIDAVTQAVQQVTSHTPALFTGGGTSDGRFISPWGAEVVEIGPVNDSIHKVNEHVLVADLPRLSAIYETVLDQLL
ncbi:succinyl-diaminopimelate desuccinylase [Sinimarinibacterium sp. CAU 1509]|uniref:succinyl-diaminopimelate desuccinylase n=1 Tax=Sinimarinibacterium sp. CAU 1509 TaxID=2562283 RepID=UPI0010ACDB7B|nr:succinyl-diaminopimelate desuccinylase [Sinimarinibacterium sp. CAU 1509]TJY62078.1 succinyl-diaminopimelate desuccinylase [Sinimarinibacterium sp. CAU 1509]